ncbi:MAG TPA: fructosamine kinase family protein [Leptospiraceae bacterium]|nr:fructosamine kinase family protein [Leptospiraceae bacterium]
MNSAKAAEIISSLGISDLQISDSTEVQFLAQGHFCLYRICSRKPLAVKVIPDSEYASAEFSGLKLLKERNVTVPELYGMAEKNGIYYIIMEYLEEKGCQDESELYSVLRNLYSNESDFWGFEQSNFIGPLPQPNGKRNSFSEHFWNDRLAFQFNRAESAGLLKADFRDRLAKVFDLCVRKWKLDALKPRLIHGDLWTGNILYCRGSAYLIDPSVSYGNPEQDIAMLHLFGSPGRSLTSKISDEFGCGRGFQERIYFWQIYPLLVHLNLFGMSYFRSLNSALDYYL